jgi:lipopolysaccharide export LptBFGC system permease protein LptF
LFNTGAYVKATTLEWDEWYPGRIVQFDANSGCYSVLFDDGESRDDVTEGNVKEYNPAGDARQDVAIAIDGEKKKLEKELQSLDDNYQYDFDEFENENTPQKVVQTKAENSTNWFDADEEDEESSASSSEDDGGF